MTPLEIAIEALEEIRRICEANGGSRAMSNIYDECNDALEALNDIKRKQALGV